MRQIIRVEHADGYGMFTSIDNEYNHRSHCVYKNENTQKLSVRHNKFNCPYEDGIIMEENMFCAYRSIEDIQKWILKEEFVILQNLGYEIYLLEVNKCQEGRDNIVFEKEDIISKTIITQLFL